MEYSKGEIRSAVKSFSKRSKSVKFSVRDQREKYMQLIFIWQMYHFLDSRKWYMLAKYKFTLQK